MTEWRALTVRDPWCTAIVELGKNVENRTQHWKYRGPLMLHTGAALSSRGLTDPRLRTAVHDRLVEWATNDEHESRRHDARTIVAVGPGGSCRWAHCSCGWDGPYRPTREESDADAATHNEGGS